MPWKERASTAFTLEFGSHIGIFTCAWRDSLTIFAKILRYSCFFIPPSWLSLFSMWYATTPNCADNINIGWRVSYEDSVQLDRRIQMRCVRPPLGKAALKAYSLLESIATFPQTMLSDFRSHVITAKHSSYRDDDHSHSSAHVMLD